MGILTEAEVLLQNLPKMVKVICSKTGRYIYKPAEEYPTILLSGQPEKQARSAEYGLDNPVVVISVAAGIIGVLLVAVIILIIWIRRLCNRAPCHHRFRPGCSNSEIDSVSVWTTTSSLYILPGSKTKCPHSIVRIEDEKPQMVYKPENKNFIRF